MDFRRHKACPAPLYINGDCVERVSKFTFLGTLISEDVSWSANTTAAVKKAQWRLHFLRVLRRNRLDERLLVTFYRSTIESLLAYTNNQYTTSPVCTWLHTGRQEEVAAGDKNS